MLIKTFVAGRAARGATNALINANGTTCGCLGGVGSMVRCDERARGHGGQVAGRDGARPRRRHAILAEARL